MRRFQLLAYLLWLFSNIAAYAGGDNAGKSAYSFLKIGVGAKAQAMAGAFAGLADDLSSIYHNPAGLTMPTYEFIRSRKGDEAEVEEEFTLTYDANVLPQKHLPNRVLATYVDYLLDFQTGFVGYTRSLDDRTLLGISVQYVSYGDFRKLDAQGNEIGTFGAYDLSLGGVFSKRLATSIAIGATAKFIAEKVEEYSSDALAVDLGLLYRPYGSRSSLGLAVTNLGFQLKGLTEGHKDPLPLVVDLGFCHHLRGLPLTFTSDVILPADNQAALALGCQFEGLRPLELRLGWTSAGKDHKTGSSRDDFAGFSGGFGYRYQSYAVDYSISSLADLGNAHRFTLGIEF